MSWQSGDPEARPTVYLPQSDGATPLAYETYADPAEAHGWRKAYTDGDDTSVLPVVPGDPAGRPDRRSHRRQTRRNKLARRLAVAGGAAGVVALGIAVSGAFDSGAAGGAGGTPQGTTRPVHLPTGPAQADDDSTATASAQPLQAPHYHHVGGHRPVRRGHRLSGRDRERGRLHAREHLHGPRAHRVRCPHGLRHHQPFGHPDPVGDEHPRQARTRPRARRLVRLGASSGPVPAGRHATSGALLFRCVREAYELSGSAPP
ncbi:hypothetical protein [Streptomyces sp. LN245]|uniref:hypothetical protein n=1 Tax=Streptomyces sp. LN245 TaxID=3112975 RepID=UPI00371C43DE